MSKYHSLDTFHSVLAQLRQDRKTIVFTNGCFDILHAGHVTYLEQAKALGDILVVAVNSDASVRDLKGPTRPINSLEDRITVLAGLESIDYILSFSTETPIPLIRLVQPDIYTKGGDYLLDQLPEHSIVQEYGGHTAILPFVAGQSTSSIIKKAQI